MTVATELFHTASMNENSRIRYWNEVANNVFGAMDVNPTSRRFCGQMKRRRFGGVQLAQVESTPVTVEGLGGAAHRGVFLLMNQVGNCGLRQRGRQIGLKPGELTVLCTEEPYLLECESEHATLVLFVPGAELGRRLADHVAVAHPTAECELLAAFLRRLGRLDGQETGPGNLLQTTLDLIELNWPTRPKRFRRTSAMVWEKRLESYVAQYLGETDLCAERIARALGISSRYVQMLFARMNTTVSHYILESRLQMAAERLRKEDLPVSDIALEAGFNDLSYFCRCFRKRFGVSARTYRSRLA